MQSMCKKYVWKRSKWWLLCCFLPASCGGGGPTVVVDHRPSMDLTCQCLGSIIYCLTNWNLKKKLCVMLAHGESACLFFCHVSSMGRALTFRVNSAGFEIQPDKTYTVFCWLECPYKRNLFPDLNVYLCV